MAHIKEIIGYARGRNWIKVKELIFKYNMVNQVDKIMMPNTGDTLLHIAVGQGANCEILNELVKHIYINIENSHHMIPLDAFILNQHQYSKADGITTLEFLLERGADPMKMITEGKAFGMTPFLRANLEFTDIDAKLIEMMKEKGANLSYVKKLYKKNEI